MQRTMGNRSKVGRKREQRARHGLRCTVASQEVGIAHNAARHHGSLQQWQDNVSTAEDQRAGTIYPFQQSYRGRARDCCPQWQSDERCSKQQQCNNA